MGLRVATGDSRKQSKHHRWFRTDVPNNSGQNFVEQFEVWPIRWNLEGPQPILFAQKTYDPGLTIYALVGIVNILDLGTQNWVAVIKISVGKNNHRVTLCFLVSNPLGRKFLITRCDQQCGISRASDEQALLSGQVLFSSHKYGTFSSATLRFLRYWVSTLKPVIHSNPSGLSYSNVDSCIYTESGSAIFSIMWLLTVRSLPE